MSTPFFEQYMSNVTSWYPSTKEFAATFSPLMISQGAVRLAPEHLQTIREAIRAFFVLRSTSEYTKKINSSQIELLQFDPKHFSALMSYDFHITQTGPKLIEINTNAAFSILADALNKTHTNLTNYVGKNFLDEIANTFFREYHLWSDRETAPEVIAILDEDVLQQKLVLEFFAWKDFFGARGVKRVIIASPGDFHFEDGLFYKDGTRIDLVYNRHTDFFLSATHMQHIRKAYLTKSVCLTPNPHEYILLADKQRMLEFSNADFLNSLLQDAKNVAAIQKVIAPSFEVKQFSAEEVWSRRKNLFFKPKQSFGGKAVYRGDKITKKVFEQVMREDYIAQEYIEPITTEVDGVDFKYDVRCYAYEDKLQLTTARLFQGQLTNFKTPGGGFATVVIDDSTTPHA